MLTDTRVRNAKPSDKPFKLTDSGGLYLHVMPGGSKVWGLRYEIAGKEQLLTIGRYCQTTPNGENFPVEQGLRHLMRDSLRRCVS